MKTLSMAFFTIIVATFLAYSDAYLTEAAIIKTQQMLKNVCLKKHAVPEETFAKCKNGDFANDDTLKCFFACTLKTMQLVSPKGILEKRTFIDKMKLLSPPSIMDVILPAIEECSDKDAGDVCENAFNFMKCSYQVNSKTMNYFPI